MVDYDLKNDVMPSLSVVITAANSTGDTIGMWDPSISFQYTVDSPISSQNRQQYFVPGPLWHLSVLREEQLHNGIADITNYYTHCCL